MSVQHQSLYLYNDDKDNIRNLTYQFNTFKINELREGHSQQEKHLLLPQRQQLLNQLTEYYNESKITLERIDKLHNTDDNNDGNANGQRKYSSGEFNKDVQEIELEDLSNYACIMETDESSGYRENDLLMIEHEKNCIEYEQHIKEYDELIKYEEDLTNYYANCEEEFLHDGV